MVVTTSTSATPRPCAGTSPRAPRRVSSPRAHGRLRGQKGIQAAKRRGGQLIIIRFGCAPRRTSSCTSREADARRGGCVTRLAGRVCDGRKPSVFANIEREGLSSSLFQSPRGVFVDARFFARRGARLITSSAKPISKEAVSLPHRTPGARGTDAASSPSPRQARGARRDRLSFRAFFSFTPPTTSLRAWTRVRFAANTATQQTRFRVTAARRAENDGDGRRACFDALGVCAESLPSPPSPSRTSSRRVLMDTDSEVARWVVGRRDEACTCVSTRPRRWTATSPCRRTLPSSSPRAPTEPRARARRARGRDPPAGSRREAEAEHGQRYQHRHTRRRPAVARARPLADPAERAARVGPTHLGPDAPDDDAREEPIFRVMSYNILAASLAARTSETTVAASGARVMRQSRRRSVLVKEIEALAPDVLLLQENESFPFLQRDSVDAGTTAPGTRQQ